MVPPPRGVNFESMPPAARAFEAAHERAVEEQRDLSRQKKILPQGRGVGENYCCGLEGGGCWGACEGAPMASKTCAGTSSDSATVLPVPLNS